MKKSLFTTIDQHPESPKTLAEHYASTLKHAALAEASGYACLWIGEHHDNALGTIPNPAVLLAAIASQTQRIRIGPAISVLPMRAPILVAEDYAMVDVLSGGRLNMGVGTGAQAVEFEMMGASYESRREDFEANLKMLLDRWGAPPSAEGDRAKFRPLQSPPPVYIATMSEEGAYRAGRAGLSALTLVTPTTASLDEVRARVDAHTMGAAECASARDTELVVTFLTCVGETEDDATREATNGLERFLELSLGHRPPHVQTLCETMKANSTGLFGTPEQVREKLELVRGTGCRHVSFFADFGAIPEANIRLCIESLAEV